MKILIYQHIVVMGGAERYLLTLLPELKKRNIDVGFFCTLHNNNASIVDYFKTHFEKNGIPVYICKTSSPYALKAASSLSRIIKKNCYTILHTHLMHAEITSALAMLLFKPKCQFVITKHGYMQSFMDVHGLDATKINKLKPIYWVEKFVQQFVHKNFAVSKGLAEFYVKTGICSANKMTFIYHGLKAEENVDISEPETQTRNNLLIIGRLRKLKGHHFLIEAMLHLKDDFDNLQLTILGDGEEHDHLVKLVNDYRLNDRVIFAGFSDNVDGYIKEADVVVFPSMAEAFGLAVLEAYNFSKPVVAFNVIALNENIIDGETGALATPYSVADLAKKISLLLKNRQLAKQMGQNGRQLLKTTFTLDATISKTIQFYKS